MTRNQSRGLLETADAERRVFGILVVDGTLALAGAGMAFAILLGTRAVRSETLVVVPFDR